MTAREQAFLEAIHEEPEDDAARAVYADWLQERGDARGEFIALQLAGATSAAARRRERALVAKHGAAWAGGLARWFVPETRVFERGFFAGGLLVEGATGAIADASKDRAWRLVRVLETPYRDEAALLGLLDHEALVSLRAVFGASLETAASLANGPVRRLQALGCAHPDLRAITSCPALPELRTLAIDPHERAWLQRAPVVARLERLLVFAGRGTTLAAEALASREVPLELVVVGGGSHVMTAPWRAVLTRREGRGDFTAARVEPTGLERADETGASLAHVLRMLPPTLRSLEVELGEVAPLAAHARAELAGTLVRFPDLDDVRVPWPVRETPARDGGRRISAGGYGARLAEPAVLEALWVELATSLELELDAMELASPRRGVVAVAWTLEQLLERVARGEETSLVHDGYPERWSIGARHTFVVFHEHGRSPESLARWFARFVDLAHLDVATFDAGGHDRGPLELGGIARPPDRGWLVAFGTPFQHVLPHARVAARLEAVPGAFVMPTGDGFVVGVAPTPAEVTNQRLEVVRRELEAALVEGSAAQLDYDFAERVTATLGPAAKELGLATRPTLCGFRAAFERGDRGLIAELSDVLGAPELDVRIRFGNSESTEPLAAGPVRTRGQLDKLLATAARKARDHGVSLFSPKRTTLRRR